jgi:long-subunit fatty acid transport protein
METGEKSNLIENWEDGIRLGLGVEYYLGSLTFRSGYYYEGCVVPDQTLTPTIPDINTRSAISIGFAYDLGPLSLGISYEKIFIGDKKVDDYVFNANENTYDNLAGDYGMKVDNIMLGVGYAF